MPLHFFLPPPHLGYTDAFKSLTIIASKVNSIDMFTSNFFIRVGTLSLRLLMQAMSSVYEDSDRDWGSDIAGAAMQGMLEREEWRDKVVWVPREWWNAMFVVVNGQLELEDMLEKMEKEGGEGIAVYSSGQEVDGFWEKVSEAKQVLVGAKDRGGVYEREWRV
jgi:hypothetical protein